MRRRTLFSQPQIFGAPVVRPPIIVTDSKELVPTPPTFSSAIVKSTEVAGPISDKNKGASDPKKKRKKHGFMSTVKSIGKEAVKTVKVVGKEVKTDVTGVLKGAKETVQIPLKAGAGALQSLTSPLGLLAIGGIALLFLSNR